MSAANRRLRTPLLDLVQSNGGCHERVETTLLELVRALSETIEDDQEVVARVVHLLRDGRVRLIGNFRGEIPHVA